MRHHFYHHPYHYHHRGWRRGYWRPYPRFGRLIGLAGLAALGYTLLDKNQQNQTSQREYVNGNPDQDW